MSIGLFNSAIRPSPKTHVVYNIRINNQQIHTKNTLVSLQKSLLSKCPSMGAKLFEPEQNRYRFENGPNRKHYHLVKNTNARRTKHPTNEISIPAFQ